jgi:hypothetical protein
MKTSNPLRQKLINMMYLILIAMIVLNPALEYIDIFTDLNRSLEYANVRLDQRNALTVATLETFSNLDPDKYEGMYLKVLRTKQIADSAVNYLEVIKQDLITESGGYDPVWHHLKRTTDATIGTNGIYRNDKGLEIKKVLSDTKLALLEILDTANGAMLDTVLRVDDKLPKAKQVYYEWEKYYFDNVPLGAVIATLTKFQNDVRVAESLVMKNYHDQVQGEGATGNYNFEFVASDSSSATDTIRLAKGVKKYDVFTVGEDGVTTLTLPSSKMGSGGGNGQATIYVYDDNNEVMDSFEFVNGQGEVSLKTDQIGEFSIKGVVKFRYPDDAKPLQKDNQELEEKKKNDQEMPFEINYAVVKSKPYISQKDYNILYLGINNPINVYHPDYTPDKYQVNISQGKVTKVDTSFYANVYRKGFASVVLKVPDGKGGFKVVAEEIFKVKELPKPMVVLYNKEGGEMPAKLFKMQKGLDAITTDMEVPADFRVIEYSITYVNANGLGIFKEKVKGSYFTGKSRELIDLAQPGDIFIFDDIQVKGPDGVNKDVDALVFNIL